MKRQLIMNEVVGTKMWNALSDCMLAHNDFVDTFAKQSVTIDFQINEHLENDFELEI